MEFRRVLFRSERAKGLLESLKPHLDSSLADAILYADQHMEIQINAQRKRVEALKLALEVLGIEEAKTLIELSDYLVKKSVWIIGGDGWAYDKIGRASCRERV